MCMKNPFFSPENQKAPRVFFGKGEGWRGWGKWQIDRQGRPCLWESNRSIPRYFELDDSDGHLKTPLAMKAGKTAKIFWALIPMLG